MNKETDWYFFENLARSDGYKFICGVDEAGRGPLAGPVCAAAVILPDRLPSSLLQINDSKKLTPNKRESLCNLIIKEALDYKVEFVSEKVIDEINILDATMLCMKKSILSLDLKPDFVLIDGNKKPDICIPSKTIVKGDALSASIAAASILAKVFRDHYMIKISEEYPNYCFYKHKGYGTILHMEKLRKYGLCCIHRRSFLRKLVG